MAECVNFGSNSLRISDDDVHAFERLLTGGVWAQVEVEWDESDSKAPFSISQLTPIQLASFNLDEYRKLRTQFSTEEWIDLLIRSMGYEPSQFSQRLKLLFLLRLIPLCERNYKRKKAPIGGCALSLLTRQNSLSGDPGISQVPKQSTAKSCTRSQNRH